MKNEIQKLIEFLNDSIKEMYEYSQSDDYDDLEQHDCRVTAEAYEFILNYVEDEMLNKKGE